MIRRIQAWWLRKKISMQIQHIQWVREQLQWGRFAEQEAEREYNQMRADLWALEAPRSLIPQGSQTMKRRAA